MELPDRLNEELTIDLVNPGPDQFYAEGTAVSVQLPDQVPSLLSRAR